LATLWSNFKDIFKLVVCNPRLNQSQHEIYSSDKGHSSLCSSLSLSYQISHIFISGFPPLRPMHEQAENLWQ